MTQMEASLPTDRTPATLHERAEQLVLDTVTEASAEGVVLALDGSVETATLAAVATDALGPDSVTALVMPAFLTSEAAARDAEIIAQGLGLTPQRVQLQPLLGAFREAMDETGVPADDTVAVENALARFRMVCRYYVANTTDLLVVGAVTRTDRLLGTVTKHGTLGADLLPFGACYRSEVMAIAERLNVPASSPAGFESSPTDAERLGVDHATLDAVLVGLVEDGESPATVAERVGVDSATAERVADWVAVTAHKRQPPKVSDDAHEAR